MERMIKDAGKMIVEGAGGAVLGSICESILKSIGQCCTYDYPVLESVKSTVEDLKEVIPKMEDHNMKLGDRQQELKELKEEMERGTRLLDELTDVNELNCFKASYNDQLVELDASLKSLVNKLRLQSALDVKELLVWEKENAEVVKKNTEVLESTKRKVDKMDENFNKMMLNLMKKQKMDDSATQLEHVVESALLAAKLVDLDLEISGTLSYIWTGWIGSIRFYTHKIFGLVANKAAENEEMTYIPVGKIKHFRMSIEDGVTLLRSCPTIMEWTDELKSEYTNKFHALENTLEQLYNRLAGIRPLKWRCGKCDNSLGAASVSTSLVDSAGFCN